MSDKYIVINDHVGRNVIGKLVSETEQTVTVNNPVYLHVQPQPTGQLDVQTFPAFFFEFLEDGTREKNNWTYFKSAISVSDVELKSLVIDQYLKINTPVQQEPVKNPKVISIDDI